MIQRAIFRAEIENAITKDQLNTSLEQIKDATQSELQTFRQQISAEYNVTINNLKIRTAEIQMQLMAESLRGYFPFHPAASCAALPPSSPPGYYWIGGSADSAQLVYCTTSCAGVTGRWRRVAYLNMTDQSQQCPDTLTLQTSSGMRTCQLTKHGCTSASYSTNFRYSQICGRISAQATGGMDGFTNVGNINSIWMVSASLVEANQDSTFGHLLQRH